LTLVVLSWSTACPRPIVVEYSLRAPLECAQFCMETGLEETNGVLLEADFWLGIISG
jgi:hypothetical protein